MVNWIKIINFASWSFLIIASLGFATISVDPNSLEKRIGGLVIAIAMGLYFILGFIKKKLEKKIHK